MCICVCVCVCVCVCACICACMHVCVSLCVSVHIWLRLCKVFQGRTFHHYKSGTIIFYASLVTTHVAHDVIGPIMLLIAVTREQTCIYAMENVNVSSRAQVFMNTYSRELDAQARHIGPTRCGPMRQWDMLPTPRGSLKL